jgi:hypothetical protein
MFLVGTGVAIYDPMMPNRIYIADPTGVYPATYNPAAGTLTQGPVAHVLGTTPVWFVLGP